MNLELIDIMVRGGAIALLCFGALQIIGHRDGGFRKFVWVVIAIPMSAYILASAPVFPSHCGVACSIIETMPALNPFLLWWAGMSLFDDQFRPRFWHVAPALSMFAPLISDEIGGVRTACIIGLYGHLIFVAVSTAGDDLVAARITFRRGFLGAAALVGLVITAVEVLAAPPFPVAIHLVQSTTILGLIGAFLFWSSRTRTEIWALSRPVVPTIQPVRSDLAARLSDLMQNDIWREEGLTIAALAARLEAPEHRLRKVINGELGHRNFSAFINEYRVEFAKTALRTMPDRPVLTIAYDSGFASLGPFNRAFRESTGMSPTEFRRATPADSEKQ